MEPACQLDTLPGFNSSRDSVADIQGVTFVGKGQRSPGTFILLLLTGVASVLDFTAIAQTMPASPPQLWQTAAALAFDALFVITGNTRDYKGSPVPAISPSPFIKELGRE